ncbi:MAG TPA: hypothetical protein VI981_03675 [Candidatus Paceibacterota bacterium]
MPSAEFFDILGTIGFIYIIAFSTWAFVRAKDLPRWPIVILLVIGIIGFLVDSTISFKYLSVFQD